MGDAEKVAVFRALQRGARELREQFKRRVDPTELLREVRALRKRAEALDPTFNLEKCKSCGDLDEEGVEKIRALQAGFQEPPRLRVLDEGMAYAVLDTLAKRDGLEPAELEIRDDCHDPNKGLMVDGRIQICRGTSNAHVLAHEWEHVKQFRAGKPLDEAEAERLAVEAVAAHGPQSHKGLNSKKAEHSSREPMMAGMKGLKPKQLGMVYGASVFGTFTDPLNNWLDATYAGKLAGQNPSLLVDAVGAAGLAYAAMKYEKYDIPVAVIGGSFLQDLIRRHIFPRIPGMPVSSRVIVRVVPQASQGAGSSGMTRPSVRLTPNNGPLPSSVGSRGKYAIVSA